MGGITFGMQVHAAIVLTFLAQTHDNDFWGTFEHTHDVHIFSQDLLSRLNAPQTDIYHCDSSIECSM